METYNIEAIIQNGEKWIHDKVSLYLDKLGVPVDHRDLKITIKLISNKYSYTNIVGECDVNLSGEKVHFQTTIPQEKIFNILDIHRDHSIVFLVKFIIQSIYPRYNYISESVIIEKCNAALSNSIIWEISKHLNVSNQNELAKQWHRIQIYIFGMMVLLVAAIYTAQYYSSSIKPSSKDVINIAYYRDIYYSYHLLTTILALNGIYALRYLLIDESFFETETGKDILEYTRYSTIESLKLSCYFLPPLFIFNGLFFIVICIAAMF